MDNLVGSTLETITPDCESVQRLLEAAERSLRDAQLPGLSAEGRFDLAYRAVMQAANAALQANGFRTLTSRPGHHQTLVQSLPKTIGLDTAQMLVLDKLRKQRNAIDYTGDTVSNGMADECVVRAANLVSAVQAWIRRQRPDLA